MVWEDLKPSDIMTREAFENAIVVNSRHRRLDQRADPHQRDRPPHRRRARRSTTGRRSATTCRCWSTCSRPASISARSIHRAGGVPAVVNELMKAQAHPRGRDDRQRQDHRRELPRRADRTIRTSSSPIDKPMKEDAGFIVLTGNLFDAAIMKTSVISQEFRDRYLSNPSDPEAFEGRAIVFDGPEDYHHRIDDPALEIDEHCMLFIRGTGPIGYPGGAEVVNMQPPAALIKKRHHALPCIGDGRQSGTSGSPSILNASPEAAAGGGLALLRTGDRVRIDLSKRTANILISDEELATRRAALAEAWRLRLSRRARRRGRRSSARWSTSSTRAWC